MSSAASSFHVEPALASDREGILRVMAFYNMQHVPGPEMAELDLACFFVVRDPAGGPLLGASGYKVLAPGRGKTTLLGVDPARGGRGLGGALQDARLERMRSLGARTVLTNADRPESIAWYMKHYGYRVIGRIPKVADFGLPDVAFWTTIEMDLDAWYAARADDPVPADAVSRAALPSYAGLCDFEPWDGLAT